MTSVNIKFFNLLLGLKIKKIAAPMHTATGGRSPCSDLFRWQGTAVAESCVAWAHNSFMDLKSHSGGSRVFVWTDCFHGYWLVKMLNEKRECKSLVLASQVWQ